jgi:hypothetical protein
VTNPESFYLLKGDKNLDGVKALFPASVPVLLSYGHTVQAAVSWSGNSVPAYSSDTFGKYIFSGTIAGSADYTNTNNLKALATVLVDKEIVDTNDAFLVRAGSITFSGNQVDYLYIPAGQGSGWLNIWRKEVDSLLLNRYKALLPSVPFQGDYVAYAQSGTVMVLPAVEIAKVNDWTDITKAASYFFAEIAVQSRRAINPLSDATITPLVDNAYRFSGQKDSVKTASRYIDGELFTSETVTRYHLVLTAYGDELTGKVIAGVSLFGNNQLQKLYPNPVREVLIVDNGQEKIRRISVSDAGGRPITTHVPDKSCTQLATGSWSPGVYIVTVQTEAGTSRHKIVKSVK